MRFAEHSSPPRAARQEGPRTTLRLSESLAKFASVLGRREGLSRNDVIVRLAELGAAQQQRLDAIAERGARRRAAWRQRELPRVEGFATADELEAAVSLARVETPEESA